MAPRARIERARARAAEGDAALAAAAAQGDAAAFAALYARHAGAIFGYCNRVLRSREEAADATHEAFVSVLERLRNVPRPILAPRPYLFRAAHNACMRTLECRRRSEDVATPECVGHDELSDTERIVFTRELQEEVRAANHELSLRHREILALRDVEHLRYDEIARIMAITPNAAAQLAWRARARLRTLLRRRAFDAIVLQALDCERALGLLELAEDPGGLSPQDDAWLARHFAACPRCSSNRAVLAEVGATYRSWVPAGTVPVLTLALLQRAGEVVGASWVSSGAGAGATTAAGGAASTGVTAAGTATVASGGAVAASVPTAAVVAAVSLAVGTGATPLAGHAAFHHPVSVARPPALISHALPAQRTLRVSGLTTSPPPAPPANPPAALAPDPPPAPAEAAPATEATPAAPTAPAPVPSSDAAPASPAPPVSADTRPALDPALATLDPVPPAPDRTPPTLDLTPPPPDPAPAALGLEPAPLDLPPAASGLAPASLPAPPSADGPPAADPARPKAPAPVPLPKTPSPTDLPVAPSAPSDAKSPLP